MYHYTNYDDWKTENPWDGMARMAGKVEYDEDFDVDDEDFDDDYEDCENEPDFESLLEHKRSK